ncbi:MAG: hydrogenase iron-sulfur subunit [Clostridiales bacterium]|nr:hydrogenase iron-sulfur subunit [Clostridiales bacterium]
MPMSAESQAQANKPANETVNKAANAPANEVNGAGEFRPLIVSFCCNWCSYAGADLAGSSRLTYPAEVKIIRVPCSCRINPLFILRAFQRGADGVIINGCHPGDCHYSTGNFYTRRRMTLLFSMLDFLGIEKERTRVEWVSAAEGARFATVMREFVEQIRRLGENKKLGDIRCKE